MKRGYQVVKYITIDYLITKLADPYYGGMSNIIYHLFFNSLLIFIFSEYEDPDFVDIVVITHNLYIMKTEDLMNKLITLYPTLFIYIYVYYVYVYYYCFNKVLINIGIIAKLDPWHGSKDYE